MTVKMVMVTAIIFLLVVGIAAYAILARTQPPETLTVTELHTQMMAYNHQHVRVRGNITDAWTTEDGSGFDHKTGWIITDSLTNTPGNEDQITVEPSEIGATFYDHVIVYGTYDADTNTLEAQKVIVTGHYSPPDTNPSDGSLPDIGGDGLN